MYNEFEMFKNKPYVMVLEWKDKKYVINSDIGMGELEKLPYFDAEAMKIPKNYIPYQAALIAAGVKEPVLTVDEARKLPPPLFNALVENIFKYINDHSFFPIRQESPGK